MTQRHEITPTEELLSTRPQKRSRAARNEIVKRFIPLAEHIAHDYARRGIDLADLTQVAMLALVKAASRFDPDHGSGFSVYASATINGELKRHFRDHGWTVRPPRRIQESHLAVRAAADRLVQRLGRSPTTDELAEEVDLDADDVLIALAAGSSYRPERIEADADEDQGPGVSRVATTEPGFDETVVSIDVERMMEPIPDREQRIIELRYWEDLTQSEIAERVGVSQMHVSRLLRKTTEQLRRSAATSAR